MKGKRHILFAGLILLDYLAIVALALSPRLYPADGAIRYTGLMLCVLYAQMGGDKTLKAALWLTALSDIFLLFTTHFGIGVFVFCFAQALHNLRFIRLGGFSPRLIALPLLSGAILSAVLYAHTGHPLMLICPVYACLLLFGTGMALSLFFRPIAKKQRRIPLLCALGMALFVGCDIFVATFNLFGFGGSIIWLFYLPSQWLLAASGQLFTGGNAPQA